MFREEENVVFTNSDIVVNLCTESHKKIAIVVVSGRVHNVSDRQEVGILQNLVFLAHFDVHIRRFLTKSVLNNNGVEFITFFYRVEIMVITEYAEMLELLQKTQLSFQTEREQDKCTISFSLMTAVI